MTRTIYIKDPPTGPLVLDPDGLLNHQTYPHLRSGWDLIWSDIRLKTLKPRVPLAMNFALIVSRHVRMPTDC